MGGWDNRADSLEQAVDRLQNSVRSMPDESNKYGPWGFWEQRDPDDAGSDYDFVQIDINDSERLAEIIASETEKTYPGSDPTPGMNIELSRPALTHRTESSPTWFKYMVRAGFIDKPRPFNHIAMHVEEDIDERTLMGYLSALVTAWQPDRLGGFTFESKKAQGHKGPQVAVGRLTYLRDGFPLDAAALGEGIDIAEADGGRYIRVPGTAKNPSLEHVLQIRDALGYPRAT